MEGKKFTVEFTISQEWVDDGGEITDAKALEMLSEAFPFADMATELAAKVVKAEACK